MRHRKDGRQFSRNTSHRRAMFRNLVGNLFMHERIVTTDAKAKELRRVAERLITKAKRLHNGVAYTPQSELSAKDKARRLHVKRQLASFLPKFRVEQDDGSLAKLNLVDKVMVDLAKRYADRPGGYTRIIKIGNRRGDNASMSIIELLGAPSVEELQAAKEAATAEAEAESASTDTVDAAAADTADTAGTADTTDAGAADVADNKGDDGEATDSDDE